MDPIEIRQIKEIILVSDDIHASRHLYRDMLGLAMPATPDRLNLARVGSQYLGTAQAGVMVHPGFTGRLHLGLEIDPAGFERAVDHLRRQGINVTIRPQQPVHGHARERGRLLPRSRREPDRALGSAGRVIRGTRHGHLH
jgi:catechol 2,3-dioxygenase-like lactoylglutathione lyase family enzyme